MAVDYTGYPYDIDKLSGVRITKEVAGAAHNPQEADVFSRKKREEAWEQLEQEHVNNAVLRAKRNRPEKSNFYFWAWGGPRGRGKTLDMVLHAMRLYRAGFIVSSIDSCMFGQRLESLHDMYGFADTLPRASCLVIDELANYADLYSSGKAQTRAFSNGLDLLRKQGLKLLGASVRLMWVNYAIQNAIDRMIVPRQYRPRSGQYVAPPWCYISQQVLDEPFLSRDPETVFGKRKPRRMKLRDIPPVATPLEYYDAASVFDTWASPAVDDAIFAVSKDYRKARESGQSGAVGAVDDLDDDIDMEAFEERATEIRDCLSKQAGHQGKKWSGTLPVKSLLIQIKRMGWQGTSQELHEYLQAEGLLNQKKNVSVLALNAMFDW